MDEQAWKRFTMNAGGDEACLMLRHEIETTLTDRQRLVFVAVGLLGASLDDVAVRVGSTRDALYRDLFEARLVLGAHLERAR
ncbi:MAG: hypothetical protein WAN22_16970 [Solirubrobacteraceae bacterium]